MQYINYTNKKCTIRIKDVGKNLPCIIVKCRSVRKAYEYFQNISYNYWFESKTQKSFGNSYASFLNNVNKGFTKGYIDLYSTFDVQGVNSYEFTILLSK